MLKSKLEACLLSLLYRADRQYFQFRQVLRPNPNSLGIGCSNRYVRSDPDKSGLTQLKEMSYLNEIQFL